MKKYLEKQSTFSFTLKIFAFFAKQKFFSRITQFLTNTAASFNIKLNKPTPATDIEALASAWQQMMPPDGQKYFKITQTDQNTAYTEIHLKCPLQGTGNVEACYKLMNYDRKLMKAVGGELVVLESQSNSGKKHCRLAIRKQGDDLSDLTPAHLKAKKQE